MCLDHTVGPRSDEHHDLRSVAHGAVHPGSEGGDRKSPPSPQTTNETTIKMNKNEVKAGSDRELSREELENVNGGLFPSFPQPGPTIPTIPSFPLPTIPGIDPGAHVPSTVMCPW